VCFFRKKIIKKNLKTRQRGVVD